MELIEVRIKTPLGALIAAVGDRGPCAMEFAEGWGERLLALRKRLGEVRLRNGERGTRAFVLATRLHDAVDAYFGGDLTAFDALPVDPGGTAFHGRAWQAMRAIAPGATRTYGELAKQLGVANGARAVGLAAARNPVPLVVPCHRVVGARGALTGYAFGLWRKQRLLDHELQNAGVMLA